MQSRNCFYQGCQNESCAFCECTQPSTFFCDDHYRIHTKTRSNKGHSLVELYTNPSPEVKRLIYQKLQELLNDIERNRSVLLDTCKTLIENIEQETLKFDKKLGDLEILIKSHMITCNNSQMNQPSGNLIENLLKLDINQVESEISCWNVTILKPDFTKVSFKNAIENLMKLTPNEMKIHWKIEKRLQDFIDTPTKIKIEKEKFIENLKFEEKKTLSVTRNNYIENLKIEKKVQNFIEVPSKIIQERDSNWKHLNHMIKRPRHKKTTILIEASRSMIIFINTLKHSLKQLFETINNNLQWMNLNASLFDIQICFYSNYHSKPYSIFYNSDWSKNYEHYFEIFNNLDIQEDRESQAIEIGFLHTLNENSKSPISQILVFGNSPCNSDSQLQTLKRNSVWKNTKYNNIQRYEFYLQELIENRIPVHTFYLHLNAKSNFAEISKRTNGISTYLDMNSRSIRMDIINTIQNYVVNCFMQED